MTDRSPSPGEKKDEDLGARGDDSQYQRPLATASKNEPGPTKAQESCGYCLYGPPALCTCGECITDDMDAYGDPEDGGYCQRCDDKGTILVCIDDMCRGAGECMHGDGVIVCPVCKGRNAL